MSRLGGLSVPSDSWEHANALGDWLNALQTAQDGSKRPWHYWETLTFREPYSSAATRRAIERHIDRVGAARAFWATEAGKVSGRLHAHALLNFNGLVPPAAEAVWNDWFSRHGRAHVDEFEQDKGAVHYVSKYVTKELADYDLQGAEFD